jgi:hypothetical protein
VALETDNSKRIERLGLMMLMRWVAHWRFDKVAYFSFEKANNDEPEHLLLRFILLGMS